MTIATNRANTRRRTKDDEPLRVMFLLTSMPVGGAETLLRDLIRSMDRTRFNPELCCLKELGPLGEELSHEIPTYCDMLRNKFDVRVLPRLTSLFKRKKVDAVVTVGCGDKMFWGRIAAHFAGVPVVTSALHSTGWPDGVGRLNRQLTPWTDAFIAVASDHGKHLIENERFPASKVRVIPNGVDTERFQYSGNAARKIREELGIPLTAPVAGIVAALRPEKNHEMFLRMSKRVLSFLPDAHFIVVGDGPQRDALENQSETLELTGNVRFLGTRSDTVDILSAINVFCLTSHNEANPVSILEALSTGIPVVATDVGSVSLTVQPGITGFLAEPDNEIEFADHTMSLLEDRRLASSMGENGRDEVINKWSLRGMVRGYENLLSEIYDRKQTALAGSGQQDQTAASIDSMPANSHS